jgi:hypothetical protein
VSSGLLPRDDEVIPVIRWPALDRLPQAAIYSHPAQKVNQIRQIGIHAGARFATILPRRE